MDVPVWNPALRCDGTCDPESGAAPNEATIRDVRFHDLPDELHNQICRSIQERNGLARIVALAIILPAIFGTLFTLLLFGYLLKYWFIIIPVAAALLVLVIYYYPRMSAGICKRSFPAYRFMYCPDARTSLR